MFKRTYLYHLTLPIALSILVVLSGCSSVAMTGRKQLLLVSDDEVLQSSAASYNQLIAGAVRSTNRVQSARVTTVGQRIARATEAYLKANGREHEAKRMAWEFNVIKDDQINAFCMPGGKIAVYDGILALTPTDDDLAVVMGHEIAHAVAKHGNERISQSIMANYGAQVLQGTLEGSVATKAIVNQLFNIGTDLVYLKPFQRKHELEADKIGLILMAMAGYNPQVAVDFWKRMAAVKGSEGNGNDFFSTHPSDEKRAAQLAALMPEAVKIYEQYRHLYTPQTRPNTPTKRTPVQRRRIRPSKK